jgi:hypothetical protein
MPSCPAASCVLQEVAAFIALRDARAGENEKAGTPCLTRDTGFSWILADPVLVEVGGAICAYLQPIGSKRYLASKRCKF